MVGMGVSPKKARTFFPTAIVNEQRRQDALPFGIDGVAELVVVRGLAQVGHAGDFVFGQRL